MEKDDSLREENRKLRLLKMMVSLGLSLLTQERISRREAEQIVESVRRAALRMFPGKETTWEIIYAPRFHRIIKERWGRGSREEI